jgi:hypothetical protein
VTGFRDASTTAEDDRLDPPVEQVLAVVERSSDAVADPISALERDRGRATTAQERAALVITALAPAGTDPTADGLHERLVELGRSTDVWAAGVALGAGLAPGPLLWPRAVEVVRRMLARRVMSTVRILRDQVRRFDTNYPVPPDWRGWADRCSDVLVLRLAVGCDCGRHRRSCPRTGCACCVPGHRLADWDPRDGPPLGVFLANAARGFASTGRSPLTGLPAVRGDAFARSMLRPVLDRRGDEPLEVGDLVARRCRCDRRFELPDGPDACPACGRGDGPADNRRERSRHVILLPRAGSYRPRPFVTCRACQNLFDLDELFAGRGCPLTGCGCRDQLRCAARDCERTFDVAALAGPCACGHRVGVGCGAARCRRRYSLDRLRAAAAAPGPTTCPCGADLTGALERMVRRLAPVRTLWERVPG